MMKPRTVFSLFLALIVLVCAAPRVYAEDPVYEPGVLYVAVDPVLWEKGKYFSEKDFPFEEVNVATAVNIMDLDNGSGDKISGMFVAVWLKDPSEENIASLTDKLMKLDFVREVFRRPYVTVEQPYYQTGYLPEPVDDTPIGDADADNVVTVADARLILRAAVGLEQKDYSRLTIFDVDNDGDVGAADARLALRMAIGMNDDEIRTALFSHCPINELLDELARSDVWGHSFEEGPCLDPALLSVLRQKLTDDEQFATVILEQELLRSDRHTDYLRFLLEFCHDMNIYETPLFRHDLMTSDAAPDEIKALFPAYSEDAFCLDRILVCIRPMYSSKGFLYEPRDFECDLIKSVDRIHYKTEGGLQVDDGTFCDIYCLELTEPGVDNVWKAIRKVSELQFVLIAEPDYILRIMSDI